MTEKEPLGLVRLDDSDLMLAKAEDDVRGATVVDSDGTEIGKVSSLFVDADERRVRLLDVAHGGLLGLGAEHRLIPVDAVVEVSEDRVTIGRTRTEIAHAPGYDPELTEFDPTENLEDLYGYYGMTPYWFPGYRYPRFPFR
ncbi:PRC-barrel domain-containing protein [Kribbella shirazensis]|uniref:Sporulation protein YlmC with PRC-barrel domain n=1 Tax=Kribbella shirazensis TaxID=1105143 RepID=A0A7X5VDU0_9ACTN|nr:PRC-barrel domain-containing protein [Kribbella shirazensis]NIK58951.1 sporulation protein YlmC with PRC-barrel domain [Kribbella shirazensis]